VRISRRSCARCPESSRRGMLSSGRHHRMREPFRAIDADGRRPSRRARLSERLHRWRRRRPPPSANRPPAAWARSVFSSSRSLGELGATCSSLRVQLVWRGTGAAWHPEKRRRRSLLRSRATDQPANPVRLHLHWRLRRRRSRACARLCPPPHSCLGALLPPTPPGLIRSRGDSGVGTIASRL